MQTLFHGEVRERGPNDYATQYAALLWMAMATAAAALPWLRWRGPTPVSLMPMLLLAAVLAAYSLYYFAWFQPAFDRLPDQAQALRRETSRLLLLGALGVYATTVVPAQLASGYSTAEARFVVATSAGALALLIWFARRKTYPAYVVFRLQQPQAARLYLQAAGVMIMLTFAAGAASVWLLLA